MDIRNLTQEQKSKMLMQVKGWRKKWADMGSLMIVDEEGCIVRGAMPMPPGSELPNIYSPKNVILATEVLGRKDLKSLESDYIAERLDIFLSNAIEFGMKELCKCGRGFTKQSHTCPFSSEVYKDYKRCSCCDDCTHECFLEI